MSLRFAHTRFEQMARLLLALWGRCPVNLKHQLVGLASCLALGTVCVALTMCLFAPTLATETSVLAVAGAAAAVMVVAVMVVELADPLPEKGKRRDRPTRCRGRRAPSRS